LLENAHGGPLAAVRDLGSEAAAQAFQAWAWNGASNGGLVTLPV
jgi:hypothetical protein